MIIPNTQDRDTLLNYLKKLRDNASANKAAHYDAARKQSWWNFWLRLLSICLSVLVGGSLFATLENTIGERIKLWLGICSFLAAALGFIQIHLRLSETSATHKSFYNTFAAIERKIDILLANPPEKMPHLQSALHGLNDEITIAAKYAPLVIVPNTETILWPVK